MLLSVRAIPPGTNITKKHFSAAAVINLASPSAQAADIVDTALTAGNLKTLVTAPKAAGLVDTLKGPGPFTVFAPTDDAFVKILKADQDKLLANKAKLKSVLTYHVVPGKSWPQTLGLELSRWCRARS